MFVAPYDYENRLLVIMKNEGIGPAIVKSVKIMNPNSEYKSSLLEWLPQKLPGNMNYKEYWTRSGDFILKPGSIDHMLEFYVDNDFSEQVTIWEEIRSTLKELTVIVEYEDVYENKLPIYKRSLKLFSRINHKN